MCSATLSKWLASQMDDILMYTMYLIFKICHSTLSIRKEPCATGQVSECLFTYMLYIFFMKITHMYRLSIMFMCSAVRLPHT